MKGYFDSVTCLRFPLLFDLEWKNIKLFKNLQIIFSNLKEIELDDYIGYGIDILKCVRDSNCNINVNFISPNCNEKYWMLDINKLDLYSYNQYYLQNKQK